MQLHSCTPLVSELMQGGLSPEHTMANQRQASVPLEGGSQSAGKIAQGKVYLGCLVVELLQRKPRCGVFERKCLLY